MVYIYERNDHECLTILATILLWGILTLIILPGKPYFGPPTKNNFRPQYWNNGFLFYLLSMAIVLPLIWHFSVLHLYYKFITLIGMCNAFGFILCIFLYFKGILLPDPGEFDMNGNPIFDFYWGVELYPHLGKYVSFKLLINSRFGLFLWQLIVLVAWKANYELYINRYHRGDPVWSMTVVTILQTVYLAKFYYWEDGYMQVFYKIILN